MTKTKKFHQYVQYTYSEVHADIISSILSKLSWLDVKSLLELRRLIAVWIEAKKKSGINIYEDESAFMD